MPVVAALVLVKCPLVERLYYIGDYDKQSIFHDATYFNGRCYVN